MVTGLNAVPFLPLLDQALSSRGAFKPRQWRFGGCIDAPEL